LTETVFSLPYPWIWVNNSRHSSRTRNRKPL
jgi:hypothetical protein